MKQEEMNLFYRALDERKVAVYQYLMNHEFCHRLSPRHVLDATLSYISSKGKSLRPALLLFSCGAAGGSETTALPAAAAVEVYHTWSLVHDDIIDRDEKRRGQPTVHTEFSRRAQNELAYPPDEAKHYGLTMAILAGDLQLGWAMALLCDLYKQSQASPDLVIKLIEELTFNVQTTLVNGETLDVQYARADRSSLNEDMILDMLWKKTGVLYEFVGRAGAMIGIDCWSPDADIVRAIASFASKCGLAFQLQDDILGIVGDEEVLGKPVGSDIREGKQTTIVYQAIQNANEQQRRFLFGTLGNPALTNEDLAQTISLLRELGGIDHTTHLARHLVKQALDDLRMIPESQYKRLLATWASYLISRTF